MVCICVYNIRVHYAEWYLRHIVWYFNWTVSLLMLVASSIRIRKKWPLLLFIFIITVNNNIRRVYTRKFVRHFCNQLIESIIRPKRASMLSVWAQHRLSYTQPMRNISSYEQEVFESIFLIARARGPWNASVGKIKYWSLRSIRLRIPA